MSRAYCCEACDDPDPHWVIERWGDAVITWACDAHLAGVCEGLQRDGEVTKLSVQVARKAQGQPSGVRPDPFADKAAQRGG